MGQLHQLLAIVKGRQNHLNRTVTDLYHTLQKKPLFAGIEKTYQPRDEDGEKLPGERQKLQADAAVLLSDVRAAFGALFSVAGAIDKTNTYAHGDVVIDGQPLLEGVPATHLLWLEKRLVDLRTIVQAMPTLDSEYNWSAHDEGGWVSEPRSTTRSKKVPRNHEKAPATERHPAQVEIYYEDTIVGDWTTRIRSGAMPHAQIRVFVERINLVLEAVKKAREQANGQEVVNFTAEPLLGYIFRQ